MTLRELTEEMRTYNRIVAYGSECSAWQDFVDDCCLVVGCSPWDDDRQSDCVDSYFADYWLAVASGENIDYEAQTGDRVIDWRKNGI